MPVIAFFPDGSDYSPAGPFTLTFNSTVREFIFEINWKDDAIFEITENLTAILSFPGGVAPPRVSIAQETTQITILDNDCEYNVGVYLHPLHPIINLYLITAFT